MTLTNLLCPWRGCPGTYCLGTSNYFTVASPICLLLCMCIWVYVHVTACIRISPSLSSSLDLHGKDDLLIDRLLLVLFHTHSVTPPTADLFVSRSWCSRGSSCSLDPCLDYYLQSTVRRAVLNLHTLSTTQHTTAAAHNRIKDTGPFTENVVEQIYFTNFTVSILTKFIKVENKRILKPLRWRGFGSLYFPFARDVLQLWVS